MSAGSHMGKGYIEIGRIKAEEGGVGINRQSEQNREMRNKWIKK